jgi:tryptophan synthase alpha chain
MNANSYDPDKPVIMAHVVAGFPGDSGAFAAARALASGGASYLEVQFPFSDPSADGPVIQTACVASLASGFTVDRGFALTRKISSELGKPVFIMSYASLVCARGVARFCDDAKAAGARGLIIPDLCADEDEGLYAAGSERGLAVVPVVAPGMRGERMDRVLGLGSEYVYAALRAGITGRRTEIGDDNIVFLERAASKGAKVLAGFGIRGRDQVTALSGHAHAAVVGSAFTQAIAEAAPGGDEAVARAVSAKIGSLIA